MMTKPSNLQQQYEWYLDHPALKCEKRNCPCNSSSYSDSPKRHCPLPDHTNFDSNPSLSFSINQGWINPKCWSRHNPEESDKYLPAKLLKLIDEHLSEHDKQESLAGVPDYLKEKIIFPEKDVINRIKDRGNTITGGVSNTQSNTQSDDFDLEKYLSDRNLKEEVVRAFRLTVNKKVLEQPYIDEEGNTVAVKYRKSDGFKYWRKGDSLGHPYGLHLLEVCKGKPNCINLNIVEGESDTHAIYSNGRAVLGTSGTPHAFNQWDSSIFEGFEEIHVWLDWGGKGLANLDSGAKDMLKSAKALELEGNVVRLVILPEDIKDPSELALQPHRSDEVKLLTIEQYESQALGTIPESKNMWTEYTSLIKELNLDITVGQALILAMSSRLLGNESDKQLSLLLVGQSSSGKNYSVKEVKKYFPEDSFIHITSMSDKALLYMSENTDFDNKIIYIDETTGEESPMLEYVIRQLLSEGGAKHDTVILGEYKEFEIVGRLSVISTMTPKTLNHENATRYISVHMPNTKADIDRILRSRMLLEVEGKNMGEALTINKFVAYQNFLESKSIEVTIPFIADLTEALIKTFTAMEQTRDFDQLITMIKTATILNYFNRQKNDKGQLIAEFEDYNNILDVANQVFGMSVGETVTKDMSELFEKIQLLHQDTDDWLTIKDIVAVTGTHRTNTALAVGKLVNHGLLERQTKPNSDEWTRQIYVKPNTQQVNETLNQSFLPTEEEIRSMSDRVIVSIEEEEPDWINEVDNFEQSILPEAPAGDEEATTNT